MLRVGGAERGVPDAVIPEEPDTWRPFLAGEKENTVRRDDPETCRVLCAGAEEIALGLSPNESRAGLSQLKLVVSSGGGVMAWL